eukprot:TRINITY_DN144_c0_g1_i1.p1 TRINITY_DN144_c0_g1~~TRINITY_DN144_c0_g1_i1.p1  ORF type:complete len:113 (-),score=19.54 TRINITY_DN144_c0_g1_i1:72-410(-)
MSAPPCPFCKKPVYFAERQTGLDGKQWHRGCLIRYNSDVNKRTSPFISYTEGSQSQAQAPSSAHPVPQRVTNHQEEEDPVYTYDTPAPHSASSAQQTSAPEEDEFEVQVEFD